jgi:amino acid efflux transporter
VTELRRTIGVGQGLALYLGAVLGPGMLALPAVAAEIAGPGSLVAWGFMVALSLPIALTFAALGRAYPEAGGFASFAEKAFGPRAGAISGWVFYFTFMWGFPFPVLIAGQYGAAVFGLGREGVYLIGGGLTLIALVVNFFGLRISGRVQVVVTASTILIIAAAIAGALPRTDMSAFEPFLPYGVLAIGLAAVQIFTAFIGWEAITPLAEEFRNPARDIRRATFLAVIVVAVMYGGLAFATIGTHAYGEALQGVPPLAAMVAGTIGAGAPQAVGIVAMFVTFATVNAYVAGTSRLGFALGRAKQLPDWFAVLHPRWQTPHHSLAVIVFGFVVSTAASYVFDIRLPQVVPLLTSATIVTYLVTMAAGIKLLKGAGRVGAVINLVAFLIVLPFLGGYLVWIAIVVIACLVYLQVRKNQSTASSADSSS